LSELINQLPERAIPIAESLGDLLLRAAVEEHGTEGLVAAVIRMRGPGEELPVRGVVHHRCSLGLSVGFGDEPRGQVTRGRRSIEGDHGKIVGKTALPSRRHQFRT
jgi:hypothetical protein